MSAAAQLRRILWIEDSENDVILFTRKLKQAGFTAEVVHVETEGDFLEAIGSDDWDFILSDFDLPGFGPAEALRHLSAKKLDIPFILVSGAISSEDTVALMRAGAKDFVPKDDISRLVPAMQREIEELRIREDRKTAYRTLKLRNAQLSETLEALREAQTDALRLQRIRAVGEMAFGVAHDFNNNLMKISGLLATVRTEVGTGAALDDHGETLDQLQEAVEDGKQVMQRVAKYCDNNADIEAEPVDLNRLLRRVADHVGEEWKSRPNGKGITVLWDLKEVGEILSKESDFQDIVVGLFANAAEAMPEGGVLKVSTHPSPDDRVLLTLIDSGRGMGDDELRRCLEPFYSTKGEFGTGMGLGIADAVTRQYGGTLSVESQPDVGTTVSLTMLAAKSEGDKNSAHELADAEPPEPPPTLRVLIAEDEEMIRELIERFLSMDGHHVDAYGSGKEALEQFAAEKYDLVLSDRSMPGMTGDELAAAVKEIDDSVPFVPVTGFGEIMIARGEKPEGVDHIVSKPVDGENLRRTVAQLADQRRGSISVE